MLQKAIRMEEGLRVELVEMVRDCQKEVFKTYQDSSPTHEIIQGEENTAGTGTAQKHPVGEITEPDPQVPLEIDNQLELFLSMDESSGDSTFPFFSHFDISSCGYTPNEQWPVNTFPEHSWNKLDLRTVCRSPSQLEQNSNSRIPVSRKMDTSIFDDCADPPEHFHPTPLVPSAQFQEMPGFPSY